ncbi:ABC transporter ATP-binding protein [Aliiglaciecola litoralis]|uniref:ABC transporter ATP-binding protein n=1 Tax=Aliiglaciecola litoralis TaxID=582857 RepID=A0ABP3WYF1_9ALTE
MSQVTSRLLAKDLKKSYGKVNAINGIDLHIDQAGVFAILGQNGAGKTSFIRCALGLESVTSGSLETMGNKPGSLSAKQQTGVILQDSDLPDSLTIKEQIQLFASYYPNPLSVDDTIAMCELHSFADKGYKKLSGGQKRRAQFALAIVGDPQLIFLDEPTTGLDIDARRRLWSIIREFANKGKTIVLTTHYLEEADNLADRIMVMNAGKIVADSTPEDIHKLVKGSVVRCQTQLSIAQLQSLSGGGSVTVSGRFSEIHTEQVNNTLAQLLSLDPDLQDLTVSQPKLEDIFGQLSQTGGGA